MSHSVTCYVQKSKQKSRLVLEAFAAGCGGRLAWTTAPELEPGPAVFYGVRPEWSHLWVQAKAEGREWYFADNAYFDVAREKYFRVTKNAIQHSGHGVSDGKRFAALGLTIEPMQTEGDYAVVCVQSDEFMRCVAGEPDWLEQTLAGLNGSRVVVRRKGEARSLSSDLTNAKRLYTWSSAAAVGAVLAGVPVTCSPQCCAYEVGDRAMWASVLADQQWTLDEMADGTCWRELNVE